VISRKEQFVAQNNVVPKREFRRLLGSSPKVVNDLPIKFIWEIVYKLRRLERIAELTKGKQSTALKVLNDIATGTGEFK
jgi:hypothetical protein